MMRDHLVDERLVEGPRFRERGDWLHVRHARLLSGKPQALMGVRVREDPLIEQALMDGLDLSDLFRWVLTMRLASSLTAGCSARRMATFATSIADSWCGIIASRKARLAFEFPAELSPASSRTR
jgi:hypothetical protein